MTPILLLILLLISPSVWGIGHVQGRDLFSGIPSDISFSKAKKGTVLVFLSAKCPCSASHEKHIQDLAAEFSDFQFVGVHSNADEPLDLTREKFKDEFKFPILQDDDSDIANEFKAFKTPHAFVIDREGKVLYRGGISNSSVFQNAKEFFLKEALSDLTAGRAVTKVEGRTLGCIITRAKK